MDGLAMAQRVLWTSALAFPWFCQLSRPNVQPIRAADFAVALSMLRRRVTINEADPDTFAVVGCSGPCRTSAS